MSFPQGTTAEKPQLSHARGLPLSVLLASLGHGKREFFATRQASVSYALIFASIGLGILLGIEYFDVAPMALPAAGGFMLVGPMLLCGYFAISDATSTRTAGSLACAFAGFRNAPRELWVLGLVCALLFMIWITDAATLYGFMVGRVPAPLMSLTPPPDRVISFMLWSSLMGAVLAFVIFAISAFAVPLIYYRRAPLVGAVVASVRAVFTNFLVCVSWAILLAAVTILSILVLPLFLLAFPILAYASHAFYRAMFPAQ